jgi:phosphoribosylanthranilate isomerase
LQPDFLQLHGKESNQRIEEIKKLFGLPIIKAIGIGSPQDLLEIKQYNSADILMFDTKIKDQTGGSGKNFDWKILQNLNTNKKWFLSGGLNIKNLEEALKITNAEMVDLSSGIEEIRGIKSSRLINAFMDKIKDLN